MPGPQITIEEYLDQLPPSAEVRRKLAENLREARLLRKVLAISEQREKVGEVRS